MASRGFIQSNQVAFGAVYRLLDVAVILLLLEVAVAIFSVGRSMEYLTLGLTAVILFLLFAESTQLYRSWRGAALARNLTVASVAWVFACVLIFTIGFFAKVSEIYSRLAVGTWMLSTLISLNLWRTLFWHILRYFRARGYNTRKVAIVGINEASIHMRRQIDGNPELGYKFCGFFDDRCPARLVETYPECNLEGTINELIDLTRNGRFDVIFIALPLKAQKRISSILEKCGDTTTSVHLISDFFTYNLLNARLHEVGDMQTLSVYDSPLFGINDVLKRFFDILFSLFTLILIAFPMLMIAVAIKLTSKGPVIFKQTRYGLDGRKIEVWKFRSMTTMDNGDIIVQATKGDARITPLGAFLRKSSFDELPQFVNVLQGRMSVVGPRPHAVAHNEEYRKLIPYYMLRHKVKPGITGLAQINGFRGETDTLGKMEGRVAYDLDYIKNWSLMMDFKIVFLTVLKGFFNKDVY